MSLLALEVEGLRCLKPARLELHTHVNLVTGANGAGKTSLLEAIYLLGRGRSFRTRHTERLVGHDAERLKVFGRTDEPNFPTVGVGYDRQSGPPGAHRRSRCAIAGRTLGGLSRAGRGSRDPSSGRGGSGVSTALAGLGSVPRGTWLRRTPGRSTPAPSSNAMRHLKKRSGSQSLGARLGTPWGAAVRGTGAHPAAAGAVLARHSHAPCWVSRCLELLPGLEPGAEPRRGAGLTPERAIWSEAPQGWGPIGSTCGSRSTDAARERSCRAGSKNCLGAALALAMARLAGSDGRRPPTLLLDDPAAELDRPHTDALVSEIRTLKGQLVVTALHPEEARFGDPGQGVSRGTRPRYHAIITVG